MSVSGISGIDFSNIEAMNEYFLLLDTLTKYGNNEDGVPPLLAAIKSKDESAIKLLLRHGANPNAHVLPHAYSPNGAFPRTALDFAAAFGDRDIVNLIIDAGAKTKQESDGPFGDLDHLSSPLNYSIIYNNEETFKALVSRGAAFDTPQCPDPWALVYMHGAIVGAKVLASYGLRPQIGAIEYCYNGAGDELDQVEVMEVMIQNGIHPDLCYKHLFSGCLQYPRETFKISMITMLLKHGANINLINEQGHTLLFYAKGSFADFLVSRGAICK